MFSRALLAAIATLPMAGVAAGLPPPAADPAIAFVARYTSRGRAVQDLVVVNADGTNRTVVLSRTSKEVWDPAWSPDLDSNAGNGYQGCLAVTIEKEPDPGFDLFLLDISVVSGVPQGSNLRKIVEDDLDPNVSTIADEPEWSPDLDSITPGYQGKIAFIGSTDNGQTTSVNLIAVAWNGATVEAVSGPNSSTVLFAHTGITLNEATWSPDGTKIAIGGDTSYGRGFHVIDAVTGQVLNVVSTGLPSGSNDWQWSRAGSRLVFEHSNGSIYTTDLDVGVSSLRAIPGVAGRWPTWSPDDLYVAYTNGGLYRADVVTGQTILLSSETKKAYVMADWRRF